MEIKIELEDWKCENLLRMHGFVTEEVTAYYENKIDHYDNVVEGALYPIKIRIAYHRLERPKVLEQEHPLLKDLNSYAYDKVVGELYNSDLWDLIVKE